LVFQGAITLGDGFLVDDEIYSSWDAAGDKSCSVIFDYLIGQEVNQSPTHKSTRKVINFFDWELSKCIQYSSAYDRVLNHVKPERDKLSGNATAEGRKKNWWKYGRDAKSLFHAIGRGHAFEKHPKEWDKDKQPLERVIVFATGATKYPCFTLVPNTYIYAHSLCVVASESYSLFACLSSDIHGVWAFEYGSRLHERLRYTHGDIFETFPFPAGVLDDQNQLLWELGEQFFSLRSHYMVEENKGMTKLYNDLHDPANTNPTIQQLREFQIKINQAVIDAYGFGELDLEHGFHEVAYLPEGKNRRFTISEPAREQLLYRLAILNKERYELELAAVTTVEATGKLARRAKVSDAALQGGLFGEGDL
jgi:hypothetical protein